MEGGGTLRAGCWFEETVAKARDEISLGERREDARGFTPSPLMPEIYGLEPNLQRPHRVMFRAWPEPDIELLRVH